MARLTPTMIVILFHQIILIRPTWAYIWI